MVCSYNFNSRLESSNTSKYLLMSMQDLCSALNQDNPVEIQAIMEVIVKRLLPEVYSSGEKKNVTWI